MPWTDLPTNFKNLVWSGLKKYIKFDNPDQTVSFEDVTEYVDTDNTQMSAEQLNQMTDAINQMMDGDLFYSKSEVDTKLAGKASSTHNHDSVYLKLIRVASDFSTSQSYSVGDYVIYNGYICRFIIDHPAGAWVTAHVSVVTVTDELKTKSDADDVYSKTETDDLLDTKQDTLTFDTTPTASSANPVTSGGIKTVLDDKADVITTSASGDPVVITDGSPAPVVDLTVGIEPVQDLHGLSNPYPAGGGKNLIPDGTDTDKGFVENKYLKSDGSVGSTTNMNVSEYFPVSPSTVYGWKKYSSQQGTSASLCYYDANKDFLSGEAYNDRTDFTTTSPSTAAFARVTILKNPVNSTLFKEGNDYPAVYEPYENICPISGRTGATITRTGKNLLETVSQSITVNGITATVNDDGSITINGTATSATVVIWNFAKSSSGSNYISDATKYFSNGTYHKTPYDGRWAIQIRGSNSTPMTSSNASLIASYNDESFIIDDTYAYNCAQLYVKNGASFSNETVYPWVHISNDYPITFPTEAGTVYGGSLNVTTGMLTVTHGKLEMQDLPTLTGTTWKKSAQTGILNSYYIGSSNMNRITPKDSSFLCSHFEQKDTYVGIVNGLFHSNTGVFYVMCDEALCGDTVEGFTQWLADQKTAGTPVELWYELITPVTYQLTQTEVTTLLGENTISADTGAVNVTYRADTKTYIDQKIAESQRATRSLIAGIETEMTATKNYSVGDLLIVGDTLYKVTANIANGNAITVGTNVSATTVAEQLILLANA